MASVSNLWRQKVLSGLYGRGTTTRAELVRATGLNVGSLSLVLHELIDFGVVQTVGKVSSTSGRKSEILRLNPEAAYLITVELEGTRNRFGVVNLAGDVRFRWEDVCSDKSELTVERVAAGIRSILGSLPEQERSRTL